MRAYLFEHAFAVCSDEILIGDISRGYLKVIRDSRA